MASRASMRATDPKIGRGILKNAVIELDGARNERQNARTKELNKIAQGRDMSVGYLALMRDSTLAGRNISRPIIAEDSETSTSRSRIRMVGRLRKKEKWLMWKYLFQDINRIVGNIFTQIAPAQLFKPRNNNLNYEEELASYLRRVEFQKDTSTCDK